MTTKPKALVCPTTKKNTFFCGFPNLILSKIQSTNLNLTPIYKVVVTYIESFYWWSSGIMTYFFYKIVINVFFFRDFLMSFISDEFTLNRLKATDGACLKNQSIPEKGRKCARYATWLWIQSICLDTLNPSRISRTSLRTLFHYFALFLLLQKR